MLYGFSAWCWQGTNYIVFVFVLLVVLLVGAVWLLSVGMAVSDTAEPDDLAATLRQLMLQQLFTFQKIRSDGNSGIKQVLYLVDVINFLKLGSTIR